MKRQHRSRLGKTTEILATWRKHEAERKQENKRKREIFPATVDVWNAAKTKAKDEKRKIELLKPKNGLAAEADAEATGVGACRGQH